MDYYDQKAKVASSLQGYEPAPSIAVDPRSLAERLESIEKNRTELRTFEAHLQTAASEIEALVKELHRDGRLAAERMDAIRQELSGLRLIP